MTAPHSPDRPTGRRSTRLVLLSAAVVVLLAAVGVWWKSRPEPVVPPLPAEVPDPVVRKAIEQARAPVLAEPQSAAAWGRLGLTYMANLFAAEAKACLEQASRIDPGDPRWPYGLALMALVSDPPAAVPLLEQAEQAADAWPEYQTVLRLQRAEALLEQGRVDEAASVFREERQRRPADPRVTFGLALVAMAHGKAADALPLLESLRDDRYTRKRAIAQLARAARLAGRPQEAEGYEREQAALPVDPGWPDPLLDWLAQLRVDRVGREKRIVAMEDQHQFREAADACLAEIEERPTTWAYIGAGINLARLHEYDRALPLLDEALRLEPGNAAAHYARALVRYTMAEQSWAALPNNEKATAWFREVVTHARRAAELKPDDGRAYLFWGLALRHLGQSAEAVAPLRKGVACAPSNFDLHLGLGEALAESGHPAEARTHLENAARLNPNDPRPARALERLKGK